MVIKKLTTAIFEVANDKEILDKVQQDLTSMGEIIQMPQFSPCLSPVMPVETTINIIEAIGKKYAWQEYSINFLKTCVLGKRLILIPQIIECFNNMYDKNQGIIRATVTSAHALSQNNKTNLTKIIKRHCDKGQIAISYEINEHMVGGFVAEFAHFVIDMSLSSRLGKIKQSMLGELTT